MKLSASLANALVSNVAPSALDIMDAVSLERALKEAAWLLRNGVANCDLTGYEGSAAWGERRAALLDRVERP